MIEQRKAGGVFWMSAKTKIVVLHMKELVYTVIFVVLAVLLILLFVFMFGSKKDESAK